MMVTQWNLFVYDTEQLFRQIAKYIQRNTVVAQIYDFVVVFIWQFRCYVIYLCPKRKNFIIVFTYK